MPNEIPAANIPSPKKAAPKSELGRELQKIYADAEGKLPDFTRLEGKPGSRMKSMLIGAAAALAVLSAAAWAGIAFFSKHTGFSGAGVEVRIEGPELLRAGDEAEITVRYRNNEQVPLAAASLAVELPDGFEFESSEPARPDAGEWLVGSLASGSEGQVKLKGLVRRERDATMTFQAALNYRPADFSSEFQKAGSQSFVVGGSAIELRASGPEQMTSGDEVAFVYEYEHAGSRPIERARFVIEPPEGFVFASSEPAADENAPLRWTLENIKPGDKGIITVRGTFSSTSRGPKSLVGRFGLLDDDAFLAIASAEGRTDVQRSDLALTMIVNGSAQPPAASFSDTLQFSISYKNAGDVALRDVSISAELPSDPPSAALIDWVSLHDELEGTRSGSTITWTKKQIPELAEIDPGTEGAIDFSVRIAKKPASASPGTRYAVNAKTSAIIGKAGRTSAAREATSAPIAIVFQSDASFRAAGRYFTEDGAPLGSGPLPPEVGQKTVYRVFWTIQNTLHELTSLTATTLLPQGVKWTGVPREVGAGELTFDESGRKPTWRLNRMPTSVQEVIVSFDVEITPSFEDAGRIIDLTGDSRFEAFDKETQTVILKSDAAVGTDLIGDEAAAGKGVVRE